MLKNLSKLELTIENRLYQLLCENDSPLYHIKEVLFQFQKYVGQIEDNIKAQQEAVKVSEQPQVDSTDPDISPEQPQG